MLAITYLRTAILLAGLTASFMGAGYLLGGCGRAVIAFFVAAAMNFFTNWNADQLVLSMHAQRVDDRTESATEALQKADPAWLRRLLRDGSPLLNGRKHSNVARTTCVGSPTIACI